MFKTHPHTNKLCELSLKQRHQNITYMIDQAIREWPELQKVKLERQVQVAATPMNSPKPKMRGKM